MKYYITTPCRPPPFLDATKKPYRIMTTDYYQIYSNIEINLRGEIEPMEYNTV